MHYVVFIGRLLVRIDLDTGESKAPSTPCQMQRGRHQCGNTCFKAVPDAAVHTNYQEIRMQESSKSLPMGAVPRSICVLLQDDLADCCQTGGKILDHSSLNCSSDYNVLNIIECLPVMLPSLPGVLQQ